MTEKAFRRLVVGGILGCLGLLIIGAGVLAVLQTRQEYTVEDATGLWAKWPITAVLPFGVAEAIYRRTASGREELLLREYMLPFQLLFGEVVMVAERPKSSNVWKITGCISGTLLPFFGCNYLRTWTPFTPTEIEEGRRRVQGLRPGNI